MFHSAATALVVLYGSSVRTAAVAYWEKRRSALDVFVHLMHRLPAGRWILPFSDIEKMSNISGSWQRSLLSLGNKKEVLTVARFKLQGLFKDLGSPYFIVNCL